jgi:uncharacterized protein YlzI (FlbEa/FlbD family)
MQGPNMTTRFILEEVAIVENDFSADSRDKDGVRVVTYEARRSIQLHLAIDHILQIEVVKDSKLGEGRSIVTLSSGHRYVTRRSAQEVCAAIAKAATPTL